jgi:O-antigen/teichoic acid export membrane protein
MKARAILVNFASMASFRVGLAAMTFGLFWILSHRLTTTQLGGFSLLMNVFFMVQTLPLLGMTMPLMRRIAARPDTAPAEISSSFFFALPVAALLGVSLAVTGRLWYADEGLTWPFVLLGLSMLPCAYTTVAECVLVGREKMQGIAYVNLGEAIGRLIGAAVAIRWHWGLVGVFTAFVVLRYAAAGAYLCNPHLRPPLWRLVDPAMTRNYRREFPTFLSIAVVTALCTRLDIVLLSKLLSLGQAGIYAAAARLSDAALMVPTMAAVVMFPTQARLFETDPTSFVRVLMRGVRLCLIAGFALALVVVALAPLIIHTVYAPKLWPAAPILEILILGAALMVIDQLLSTTMMAAHAQDADLRSMCVGLVTLVALLVGFTRIWGLEGAAAAPPAALLVRVLYRLSWAQRRFQGPFLPIAVRALLAAGAAVGLYFLPMSRSVPLDLALSLAVYALLLGATRAVGGGDLLALRELLAQRRGARA